MNEKNENAKFVAEEIKRQISPTALICSGAKNFAYGDVERGALSFDIKGTSKFPNRVHKVMIVCTWADLYRIKIIDRKGNLKAETDGIYCDQLTDTLESLWETEETMKKFIPANQVKYVITNIKGR